VSELSHDAADDGFHEIQLSGKQLVFLFIVTTTVIVVVFLCGVKVGRGVRAAQGDEPEQAPAAATAAPSQPQPVAESGPPAAEPPAPAAETPEQLSYHKRLQGSGAPTEKLKSVDESKAASGSTAQPPASAAASKPPAAATARQTPAAPAQQADAGVPSSGRPGTWVVQVIATRDRDVASSVVKKLAAKGYPAFLVTPTPGAAQPFYKVHVGRYDDRGEAEQVSTRIKKEEQFQSWITR
jgi:cell division septation protein DedD